MPKPTDTIPMWSTDQINEVEPSTGEMDAGFADNDVPTAAKINWMFRQYGDWITYLDGLAGEDFTWTGTHVFNEAITVLDNVLYAAPIPERFQHVWPLEFVFNTDVVMVTGGVGSVAGPWYLENAGAAAFIVRARVRIPAGATITDMAIAVKNTSGLTVEIQQMYLGIMEASGSKYDAPIYAANAIKMDVATAFDGWKGKASLTSGTWTNRDVSDDCYIFLGFSALPKVPPGGSWAAGTFQLHGIKVTYSQPAITPQA